MSSPSDSLFPQSLVPPPDSLPQGYTLRPLRGNDHALGHLDPLRDLAAVGEISETDWRGRFEEMRRAEGVYYVVVIEWEGPGGERRIVGTGTLVVERKFLFKLGIQGHVEDIAIVKAHQGKQLGGALLAALNRIAREVGCYKNILDCSLKNSPFYEKCGFTERGIEMDIYFDEEAREAHV
ncbi:putative glucosamine 6-phosphate N-acetyltransferase 1 [Amylocarpus encephaloides]|uniref:Glucosamine 6-phosphate N-acetyltransferase n=1 Tax=Amylocarpus encephaloides TaxID=45428 RepID=A0A9P8C8H7_9HELO|nr:putative glucosamine 6-phosphate N-acetyltransferase 1 [Amylocarpus encephaloides]